MIFLVITKIKIFDKIYLIYTNCGLVKNILKLFKQRINCISNTTKLIYK